MGFILFCMYFCDENIDYRIEYRMQNIAIQIWIDLMEYSLLKTDLQFDSTVSRWLEVCLLSWSERRTVNPEVVGSFPAKTEKTENSNLHGFEVHRPSSKGTKLLLQVIKGYIDPQAKVLNYFYK